jgi:hypothetical protein
MAKKPLYFSQMVGITFVDTLILSDAYFEDTDLVSLLFDECVHVLQYCQLGVERFMRRYGYIQGWASNGMDYFAILSERDAYELERQFRFQPHPLFILEDAVALRLNSLLGFTAVRSTSFPRTSRRGWPL